MKFEEAEIKARLGHVICRLYVPEKTSIQYLNNEFVWSSTKVPCAIKPHHFLATDWEVVDDDKDWNLADNSGFEKHCGDYVKIKDYDSEQPRTNANLFERQDVKKTRDLILEDIKEDMEKVHSDVKDGLDLAIIYINKRFGDLK